MGQEGTWRGYEIMTETDIKGYLTDLTLYGTAMKQVFDDGDERWIPIETVRLETKKDGTIRIKDMIC